MVKGKMVAQSRRRDAAGCTRAACAPNPCVFRGSKRFGPFRRQRAPGIRQNPRRRFSTSGGRWQHNQPRVRVPHSSHPTTPTSATGTALHPPQVGDLAHPGVKTQLLGVAYHHFKTPDDGDLYLTDFGLPFRAQLHPENWYAADWFAEKRERLLGTSTVYKVPTRPVQGKTLNLVVKWSRVGEVVPLDTFTFNKFMHAEFNSPFEEFAVLMELRRGDSGPPGIRIRTQRPLAIYVPGERMQDWQSGRSEDRIRAKIARHPGVEIDMLRQYVVVFGWIDGRDAVETAEEFQLDDAARRAFLGHTTSLVIHELERKGYRVIDMKPNHIILRPQPERRLVRDRNGQFAYALVDYELLERTPEHEHAVRLANRRLYLQHMAHRFDAQLTGSLPAHLEATQILGVDYIFGRAESTGGYLWVVGKDPDLFNYFLPERWRRTPHKKLSSRNQIYSTWTKDDVNLVWKVSRLGDEPRLTNAEADQAAAREYGFNSPFEEIAFALELQRRGVPTVYPRAIYMTGRAHKTEAQTRDDRRYAALAQWRCPDGEPAVRQSCDYITLWGFWNGPDSMRADQESCAFRALNAKQAGAQHLISAALLEELRATTATKLASAGFEDLNPKLDHLLLAFDARQQLVRDTHGQPETRLCNFEFMRRRSPAA
jgi:hypothetical protein